MTKPNIPTGQLCYTIPEFCAASRLGQTTRSTHLSTRVRSAPDITEPPARLRSVDRHAPAPRLPLCCLPVLVPNES
jgi:hypothetical protein